MAFLVAFVVRALNAPPDEFDSDLDCESPTGSNRQPLIHSQRTESFNDQENSSDQEPIRTHSWSQRMREKVDDIFQVLLVKSYAVYFSKKLKKIRQYSSLFKHGTNLLFDMRSLIFPTRKNMFSFLT